jgi:hypothetical protein
LAGVLAKTALSEGLYVVIRKTGPCEHISN